VDEDTGLSHGEATPVTTPSLWSGAFALSADGARIAYVAQDERSGLVGVDFDPETGTTHGEQRTVTRGALIVSNWEMSPNGEWIAMTNRGQQEDLFLVRPDGRGLRKLTDDLHKDRGVTWLDDDRLAFYSSRSGGYEVWTMRRDGSDLHQVTETSGLSLWMPQVSSDGSRMIAHNSEGTYLWELGGQVPLRKETALHLERIEGGEMTFRGFFWSPDGTRILGTAVAPLKTVVAVYDLRDRSYRLFDTPRGTIAAAGDWLPDGRRFVASAGEAAWVVDGDSGSWRELPIELNGGTARLTPDGRMLHYAETTTEADIWVSWIE
jgi:Tol biopolymer transport system component